MNNSQREIEAEMMTEHQLEGYFRELKQELNFRLLCEGDLLGDTLWVEAITLTNLEMKQPKDAPKSQRASLAEKLKKGCSTLFERLKRETKR